MSETTWRRLFGWRHAFDEPVVVLIVAVLGAGLVRSPMAGRKWAGKTRQSAIW